MKIKRTGMVLFLLLLAGALIGSALWSLLSSVLPAALNKSFVMGATAAPWVLDLVFVEFTFGIKLDVNIGTLLGMIAAVVLYYKA